MNKKPALLSMEEIPFYIFAYQMEIPIAGNQLPEKLWQGQQEKGYKHSNFNSWLAENKVTNTLVHFEKKIFYFLFFIKTLVLILFGKDRSNWLLNWLKIYFDLTNNLIIYLNINKIIWLFSLIL